MLWQVYRLHWLYHVLDDIGYQIRFGPELNSAWTSCPSDKFLNTRLNHVTKLIPSSQMISLLCIQVVVNNKLVGNDMKWRCSHKDSFHECCLVLHYMSICIQRKAFDTFHSVWPLLTSKSFCYIPVYPFRFIHELCSVFVYSYVCLKHAWGR